MSILPLWLTEKNNLRLIIYLGSNNNNINSVEAWTSIINYFTAIVYYTLDLYNVMHYRYIVLKGAQH